MSRRKRGIFDPDYRTKEYRGTAFSPRRSGTNISQISLAIAFLLFVSLYAFAPNLMKTTSGIALALGGMLVVWVIIGTFLRLITRRHIKEDHRESYFREPAMDFQGLSDSEPSTVSFRDFEHEVAHLFNMLTSYKAVVVGGSGDKGVDLKLYDRDKLVGIVQCKQYNPDKPLPPGFIRELHTCKQQHNVKLAILVTTARLSSESKQEAESLGIEWIDHEKLDKMRQQAREKRRIRA